MKYTTLRILTGLLFLAAAAVSVAQQGSPRSRDPEAKPDKPAKNDKILRAEAKLAELSQPPPTIVADELGQVAAVDAAQARLDQAQKLLRTGLWLKKNGETEKAAEAAAKALALLNEIPAAEPALAAKRAEMAGLIHERLTGDTVLARQSFEAARQVSPATSKLADSRLKRTDPPAGTPQATDGKDKLPKPPKG